MFIWKVVLPLLPLLPLVRFSLIEKPGQWPFPQCVKNNCFRRENLCSWCIGGAFCHLQERLSRRWDQSFFKTNLLLLNPVSFAVKGFGVIGGGAVLFAASSLAGSAILPLLGIACPHFQPLDPYWRICYQFSFPTARSILKKAFSILRSVRLGRSGRLGWGGREKKLLCSTILQVR